METIKKIVSFIGTVILSFMMLGLAQICYGKIKRGFILYVLAHILLLTAVFIILQPIQPFNVIISVIIFITVYLFVIVDSFIVKKNPENRLKMQPGNIALLVGLFIVNSSFIVPLIQKTVRENVAEAFQIPGVSMSPSLLPGDFILVNKLPNIREPKRGDIVVFHSPSDAHRTLIKRVVGLSGENIEVKDNNLYINNAKQIENYTSCSLPVDSPEKEAPKNFGPATAREGSFFVLNDNRNYGQDGRSWGFLEKDELIGKAATIYWSWDKETHSIRWDRIGKAIK